MIKSIIKSDLPACLEVFHRNGEEFIIDDFDRVPDKFCAWAWADIRKNVVAIMSGSNFPWIKYESIAITDKTTMG